MIQLNNDLATKALMSIENGGLEMAEPSRKRATMSLSSSADTQRSAPLKRSRSFSRSALSGSFNMGEFLKASQKVEETIAFPAIEWPSLDDDDDDSSSDASSLTSPRELRQDVEDDDDDDDEEEDFFQGRRKRQCRGLTRCNRSCNLSSLCEHSNRSERRGSNGSMS